ncbi:hypothetical protein AB7092_03985 [Providencia rettgeri]
MFSKDPKKTTIDPVSIVKDEAVNQVKNKVQSKVNELVSSKVQKAAALAQQGGGFGINSGIYGNSGDIPIEQCSQ